MTIAGVRRFGWCALPDLFGAPQSAKTTAPKAALSVVGNTDIVQGMLWSIFLPHKIDPRNVLPMNGQRRRLR